MKYRPAYVIAGIVAVVVAVIIASIIDPTGKKALPIAVGAPILLLAGMLLYQWKWATSQEEPRRSRTSPRRCGRIRGGSRTTG